MNTYQERYKAHADAFESKVASVQPGQWENQSPCAEWTARGVVEHIVVMHGAMLSPLGLSLSPSPSVDEDPLAAFRSARADVEAQLNDPAVVETEHPTPSGPMSYGRHVDEVVSEDMVMHGWDLAKATGQDATLDPRDVARMWPVCQQMPAEMSHMLHTPGAFGPGIEVYGPLVDVRDDATDEERLIAFCGRDPYSPSGRRSHRESP